MLSKSVMIGTGFGHGKGRPSPSRLYLTLATILVSVSRRKDVQRARKPGDYFRWGFLRVCGPI